MRFEQVVLHLPGDEFQLPFNPRMTVVGGVDEAARADLLSTLVTTTAGVMPNASVIYADQSGRRVFADRTGATYGDDGEPAPTPADLIGGDPEVLAQLMTLRAEDLGLGGGRSPVQVRDEIRATEGAVDGLREALADVQRRTSSLAALNAELEDIDDLLARSEGDAVRWAWVGRRAHLDALRTELVARTQSTDADQRDAALLDAAERVRDLGEVWAEAAAGEEDLRDELGERPAVSAAQLDTVARTRERRRRSSLSRWRTGRLRWHSDAPPPRGCSPTTTGPRFPRTPRSAPWPASIRTSCGRCTPRRPKPTNGTKRSASTGCGRR